MKNSNELKTLAEAVRNEILDSYKSTLGELIVAYKELVLDDNSNQITRADEDVDTDGYISLPTGVILVNSEHEEDMLVLERIHTNGKNVETVQNFDVNEMNLEDVSNENIIFIISQMEEMIKNPDKIEIE